MKSLEFKDFLGIDVRNLPEASDPRSLRSAKNIELTTGKSLVSRDQFRLYARVSSASRGLYVVNDLLRCALPYPAFSMAMPRPPVDLIYDILADTNNQPHIADVENVESVAAWDNRPYLCVRVNTPGGTRYRHYFIPGIQVAGSGFVTVQVGDVLTMPGLAANIGIGATVWLLSIPTSFQIIARAGDDVTLSPAVPVLVLDKAYSVWWPIRNQVAVPFEPGPPVLTAAEKVWAADVAGRNVWFSSTENGPTDWTALDDAGFLPTSRHVDGDQPIRGLGIFRTQLAVFFDSVSQIWTIDPDPVNMAIEGSIGGAGTQFPGTVENVMGDLYYFSNGGFRSMSAVITTGQQKDGDIGAKIQALTDALDPTNVSAVWSPRRQQYICVLDDKAFVFTNSPDSGTFGWGSWDLPWPVASIVEWRNRIYVRRADEPEIYVLDASFTDEEDYSWFAKFNFSDGEVSNYLKHYKLIDVHSRGEYTITYGFNPEDETDVAEMGAIDGSTPLAGKVAANCMAILLQTQFSGNGPWQLGAFTHRFDRGNLV